MGEPVIGHCIWCGVWVALDDIEEGTIIHILCTPNENDLNLIPTNSHTDCPKRPKRECQCLS